MLTPGYQRAAFVAVWVGLLQRRTTFLREHSDYFGPALALFEGTGPSATLYDFDDGVVPCGPGSFGFFDGTCLESELTEIGAPPGTYTLALVAEPNQPNGPTLGDGFTGGGDFMGRYP